jgi:hypothetical protein
MKMINFDYFYREECPLTSLKDKQWDFFVSAWDGSERVRQVFDAVRADVKLWIIHPEYGIATIDLPDEDKLIAQTDPAEGMTSLIQHLKGLGADANSRICVDITGMMRPQIAVLTRLLKFNGIEKFDAIYSQPDSYSGRENTKFSSGVVAGVQEIVGFEGINSPAAHEVLIVAPGFDDVLLREVFSHKERATRVQIFGLPSLQPDMYQHNVLKAYGIDTPLPEETAHTRRFASASDPFAMASELSSIVGWFSRTQPKTRFYISPLATKAQMLGAALFHMTKPVDVAASIIYPVVSAHTPGTSTGIAKLSINTIDFQLCDALVRRAAS